MKLYLIAPAFELYGKDVAAERTRAAIALITQLVCDALRDGDDTQLTSEWRRPDGTMADVLDTDSRLAIVPLRDAAALHAHVEAAIDPNGVLPSCHIRGADVRSAVNCRAVSFGYDGQAFLCLRFEDPAPVSTDPDLAVVEERSDWLATTDYLDGLVPG
ncbi:hypothetical protein P6144_13165 [Sphingomonas sp. HITSZ_GF]|uniref:hypothetical protein n=1 Tax=Sphingomonas sp. HITSZ_GF TaxID=3037247 RepID=UPI00240E7824|nr:hypothetical protein [Sphingomonas sp. HITSZ_GF]MDG2534605.1 hypothetical protein [Sphingomonas sp. HITSZ_GF]